MENHSATALIKFVVTGVEVDNYNRNGGGTAGSRVNPSVIPTSVDKNANRGTKAFDKAKLYQVADANVVNLNKGATADITDVDKRESGEI